MTRWLHGARWLPGAVLGVFVARVVGEQGGLPGVWAAVLLTMLLMGVGAWLLARRSLIETWPAAILLAYVIQPEARWSPAMWTMFVCLASLALNWVWLRATRAQPAEYQRGRRLAWVAGGLLFAAFLALYVVTLAPDVLAADSGELQTVAAQLGVAHPPGFPLYIMLANLFTRLPSESPAYAVNLFSAVTGALTVLIVYASGLRLTGRVLPALIGAVGLGTATTFWSQATTANVRSLTGLFAAMIIYALLSLRIVMGSSLANRSLSDDRQQTTDHGRQTTDGRPLTAGRADGWLTLAALFMGFGLAHHVSLAFLILVGLVFVVWVDPSLLRSPRRWLRPIAAGLLGLLPLLYLPLRASADVRGASPALATWAGFVEHILATGFRGDLFAYLSPSELGPRLLVIGNVLTFQFAPLLLAGMLAGLVWLLWRDRKMAFLLGGAFAIYVFVAATYRAPQTVEYMMPAYVPAALLLALGVGRLPELLRPLGRLRIPAGALLTALALAATLSQFGHASAAGANHEGNDARRYAGRLLAGAPPDSVILAHWHWATPLWYLQEMEGRRPDVVVNFVFPEGEPYDTTWTRRTAEAFAAGRPVITTWVPTAPLPDLPVPEPIGEALLYQQEPRVGLPAGFTPARLTLGSAIDVLGYRVKEPSDVVLTTDHVSVITIAWRPTAELPADLSLFLHLVGEDGVLYAQDDQPARAAEGITLTQFRAVPRPTTPQGDLTVYVGVTSDGQREPLATVRIGHNFDRPLTRNPVNRTPIDTNAYGLIGYDWDHTVEGRDRLYLHWAGDSLEGFWTTVVDDDNLATLDLPPYRGPWGVPVHTWRFPRGQTSGHYVPLGEGIVWTGGTLNGLSPGAGESLTLSQEFRSGRPINRDYVVSVRLIGYEADEFHWAWWDLQDSVPALGAIPTLKWVDGSVVRSPHRVTVWPDAPPGQTLTGALTLYDAFTNRPLPILDERITDAQPWIPLCSATVEE